MSAADAALEAELRSQLQEQIHGLAEVEEALQDTPDDPDLLELKSQFEQGIVHFRDSLQEVQQHLLQQQQDQAVQQQEQQQELQQQLEQQEEQQQQADSAWDQHLPQQQQDHVRPRWLLPGVHCRFRFSDGLWHPGVVHEWLPQQQLPVTVHFAYPTRCAGRLVLGVKQQRGWCMSGYCSSSCLSLCVSPTPPGTQGDCCG